MANFAWIVVGAGFTGATVAERIAAELDQRVLVIDRRGHVGGNAFDYAGDHGILIHKYGPHIFHTNSERVWSYLSRFTHWRPYEHRVLGSIDGVLAPIPFNLDSLEMLFPRDEAVHLAQLLAEVGRAGARGAAVLAGLGVELGLVPDRAPRALQEQVGAFTAGKFGLGAEVACHVIFLCVICRSGFLREPSAACQRRWAC